jgi:hypothetical protein
MTTGHTSATTIDPQDAELKPDFEGEQNSDQPDLNTIPLNQFIADFGQDLMNAVSRQNPPVYDGNANPVWDGIMNNLKRQPFAAQRERVQAVCKLLTTGEQAAVINGDMGTGKSMMGICAAALLHAEGYRRTLIISPPHLVYKWRREILETIDGAVVWVLNGPDTLRQLIKIRARTHETSGGHPEFFIIGRVRMRLGFDWQPVVKMRKVHTKHFTAFDSGNDANDDDTKERSYLVQTVEYAACPDCGGFVLDDENQRMRFHTFLTNTDKRCACQHCGAQLWTLKRSGEPKDRNALVHAAICKIPTIGPKTADKLLAGFGAETLGSMLGDNMFEFINLMDENGDLVFSDTQAKRMEVALAKQEFGFGQGGYQASEFIKRYLPDGYFDLLLVDECHEYKNSGSAQGQAMGVLAAKARKSILLTGTLMGGYAEDLFVRREVA